MADKTFNFDDLSPEEQQTARSLAAQQTGPLTSTQNLALQGSVMRDPYAPVQHVPGEGLRAGMAAAQQNVANLPSRIVRALGAQPGSTADLAGAAGSGALNFLTSPLGTPEGAAIGLAMGPARAAGNLLPRFGNLAQMGGLGAVGGAASGLTGGDVTKGTAEGLGAGAVGAIFKKVSDAFAQKKEDALNLGKAVVKEVPWLSQLIPQTAKEGGGTIGPLLAIRDPAVGQQLLSTRFEQVKNELIAAVGKDTPIDLAALDAGGAAALAKRITSASGGKMDAATAQAMYNAAQKAGMLEPKTLTMETAFNELLKAKALARNAPDGATGWTARERARQIQEGINGIIADQAGPGLLAKYQDAMQQYGKGMAIFDVLGKSGVLQLNRTGGRADLGKLAKYLQDNIDEYGPMRFPDLYSASNRRAGLGAADVQSTVRLPRVYGRGMSEGAPAVSFNAPTGQLGAPQMGNPAAGLRPALGSLMLPEWALQQPPAGPGQQP